MRSDLVLYLVIGVFFGLLVWLADWRWRRIQTVPAMPNPTRHKREPKPFAGYIHR
jgi:hypothetical protein